MQSERLILGDTLNFATSVPDYLPTDGWVLKFRLTPRTGTGAQTLTTVQDSADSSLHRLQVSAAETAAWTAGVYSWFSYVEKASTTEKYSVDEGVVTLVADPRTATTLDLRSAACIALDQAKAALAAWTPTTKRYRIGDREMEFQTQGDIVRLINYWEIEVRREQNAERLAEGLRTNRRVFVRLSRA
jgi:hypothetical protein